MKKIELLATVQLRIFKKYGISPEDNAFQKFLADIERILKRLHIKVPQCFISYAWEDKETAEGKTANEQLHKFLLRIQSDLEKLGIGVFVDITDIDHNMREWMEKSIEASEYIILIGTPRLKERVSQITNAAFEFTLIRAKIAKNPNALIPLLYKGEFGAAFPDEISKKEFIRDIRNESLYWVMMVGLINPVGIIPSLFPVLRRDQDFKSMLEGFQAKLQLFKHEASEIANQTST